MHPELDQELCKRFPGLFADRHLPTEVSAMGWGFECGDGWFRLIACLCEALDRAAAQAEMPPIVVTQVKEKLGSLRFRYRGGNELTYGMVRMAERLSEEIDETTGLWCPKDNESKDGR